MAVRVSASVLIGIMCLAEILLCLSISIFATLLPEYRDVWSLTNTQAGWISASLFAGYTVAAPFLVSLTDKKDPKIIFLISAGFSAAACFGFALFATGLWSAIFFHSLIGVGLAGIHMPGLKGLSDRLEERYLSRATAFYTSSFGVGTGMSFLFAGIFSAQFGSAAAFVAAGFAAILAFLIVAVFLPFAEATTKKAPAWTLSDLGVVLKNRTSMAYTLCYALHNWELFGLRTWAVAFLLFTIRETGATDVWVTPIVIATMFTVAGMPASVTGNELARRFGRRKIALICMTVSALICFGTGFSSAISYGLAAVICMVHGVVVVSESAVVTAGAIGNAREGYRGATMAVHSTLGFVGAIMGPLAFGWMLDFGGGESTWGFVLAFGHMGVVMLMGPVVLWILKPDGLKEDHVSW